LISVERFAARDLVVLTTRTPVESPLAGLSVGEIRLTESPDSRSAGDVLFASIAGFKGLERPIVILVDLDDALLNSDHFHELCYVGFSRAKSHLILVGQQHVLPRLK
jgi:superfamily I DNA/RNA helicase